MFCESRLLRMKTTRRSFLGALTAGAVCSAFAWEPPAQQLPIAFSTLGCPAWDLAKILDFAAANGFAAIELRGLQGNLDLPSHPAFTPDHLEQTKQAISAHKLRIACVSSISIFPPIPRSRPTTSSKRSKRFPRTSCASPV